MADKPPPYNPYIYPNQPQNVYPPPPPPYQTQPMAQPMPQPMPQPMQMPTAPLTATVVTGITPYGRSTTIVTGPSYGTIPGSGGTAVVVQTVAAGDVILVGGCPACRVGVLEEEFTLAGLCCAFLFFPVGILCCLAMRDRRCTNCHATFSV